LPRPCLRRVECPPLKACLAPDIVEAIVEGREPSGLSLERIANGMPMGWEEQRKAFGLHRTT
jgi:hypothetical protein